MENGKLILKDNINYLLVSREKINHVKFKVVEDSGIKMLEFNIEIDLPLVTDRCDTSVIKFKANIKNFEMKFITGFDRILMSYEYNDNEFKRIRSFVLKEIKFIINDKPNDLTFSVVAESSEAF